MEGFFFSLKRKIKKYLTIIICEPEALLEIILTQINHMYLNTPKNIIILRIMIQIYMDPDIIFILFIMTL